MTAPAALALLITAFADERQRARALGLNGTLLSGGFTVGALAGGMLVGVLSWRWAFLIMRSFALVILALTPIVVPAGRSPERARLDVPGAASVTLGLLAVVYGIIEWFVPSLIAGAILLALFFWIERRAAAPLVAIRTLARPSVRWGNLAALTIFSMEAGLVFLMTIYLQDVLQFGWLTTGLVFGVPRPGLRGRRSCRGPHHSPPRRASDTRGRSAGAVLFHRSVHPPRRRADLAVAAGTGAVRRLPG